MADGLEPNQKGEWPSAVGEKAAKMMAKTDEVTHMFNLPSTEIVIQDYYCSLEKSIRHSGRMWITPNYICFNSGLPFNLTEHFPFRLINEMKRNVGNIRTNSIGFFLKDERVFKFHSFMKADETYSLLNHLWQHVPMFATLDTNPFEEEEEDEIGVRTNGNSWANSCSSSCSSSSSSKKKKKKSYDVNVDGATKAVALATEGKQKGIDILAELDAQKELLNRMEGTVENIQSNLERCDRLLQAIEGAGGALHNLCTRDKTKRMNTRYIAKECIALKQWNEVAEKEIFLDILLKLQSDELVEAQIGFTKETFFVIDKEKKTVFPQCKWEYSNIRVIVLRARHLHLDIRFKDKSPRFRLMSSFIQGITNELVVRTAGMDKERQPLVLFEPSVKRFDYGSFDLSLEILSTGPDGETVTVVRKKQSVANLLSDEVDDETKQKVRDAEESMKEVHNLACDLEMIGDMMATTLEDHTAQLENIAEKTRNANEDVKEQNRRIVAVNRELDK